MWESVWWGAHKDSLVLLKEHLSSAFGIPPNWFSGQISMPTVSSWGLECRRCHKPHAGWEHLVSEEELFNKYFWTTMVICIYLEGKRLNRADVFCIVAQHPGQTHLERGKITSSWVLHILQQHFTFFSSASCSSVNACSPEFSYQNLRSNQSLNQM